MGVSLLLADKPNPTDDQDEFGTTECELSSCGEVYSAHRTNASRAQAIYYSSHTLSFFVDAEQIQVSILYLKTCIFYYN